MTESSRGSSASLRRALALAGDALSSVPAGVLTDFDGTLSPIVAEPGLARLVDGASGALRVLAERLAVAAIVTGRAAADARRLVETDGVLVVGNHGLEWLEPGERQPTPPPGADDVRRRLDGALAAVPSLPGVVVEHKGLSATVHYRNAPDPDEARATLIAMLSDVVPPELEYREGRRSVEVRPRGLGDKGSATRAIVERYSLRGALVMGDDVTDLDMFRAVAGLRVAGVLRAAIVAVGGGDREVPPEVAEAADAVLEEPAEAAALLAELATIVPTRD